MNISGALALTGAILLFASIVFGAVASETEWKSTERLTIIGWTSFGLSLISLIASAWTAALS